MWYSYFFLISLFLAMATSLTIRNYLIPEENGDIKLKNPKDSSVQNYGNLKFSTVADKRPSKENYDDRIHQMPTKDKSNKNLKRWIKDSRYHPKSVFNGDRVQFQIQGHEGPKTYIFGYDTGHGKNRQFRLEEKLRNGTVRGQYGYYDARGKLKTVEYIASPLGGYEEKHHENEFY